MGFLSIIQVTQKVKYRRLSILSEKLWKISFGSLSMVVPAPFIIYSKIIIDFHHTIKYYVLITLLLTLEVSGDFVIVFILPAYCIEDKYGEWKPRQAKCRPQNYQEYFRIVFTWKILIH